MAFWRKDDKKKAAGEDPQAYVARREYDKAIQAYRSLIAADPSAYVHHHKLADVFCLAGRESESLPDYSKAADGYAKDGFLIKAVAILKKMQKLAPADASISRRLDALSSTGSSSSSRSGAPEPMGDGPEIALDMEELSDDDAAIPLSAPDEAVASEEAPAAARASIPMEMDMEEPAEAAGGEEIVQTPLFSELKPDELREVVAKLRHHSFSGGAVLVKEGEPGDSLFVLCQGRVEVSTHGPKGEPLKLAELGEGDFFGEVSLLTGKPRTATISSLEETDVLELTRGDLDELAARHPRVRQVIKDFYERRVASTVEAMIQAVRSPKKNG